jgi:hypothetical protein
MTKKDDMIRAQNKCNGSGYCPRHSYINHHSSTVSSLRKHKWQHCNLWTCTNCGRRLLGRNYLHLRGVAVSHMGDPLCWLGPLVEWESTILRGNYGMAWDPRFRSCVGGITIQGPRHLTSLPPAIEIFHLREQQDKHFGTARGCGTAGGMLLQRNG